MQIDSEIDRRDPDICRFTSPRTLYVGARTVETVESAASFPLAQKIMDLTGVRRIQLIGHLLVVHKTSDRNWDELIREVQFVLTSYLISNEALTPDDVEQQMMLIGRSTREKVQYLIDAQINPGVAEHGGSVQVVEVNDDKVYLRLHGGCQGCSAADFTLKQGIETIVKRAVPEIQQVIDLTNHSVGLSPYYRRVDVVN
jgi:NFU1 iron-sulfur cluster scaffold homolog, mitochondrial